MLWKNFRMIYILVFFFKTEETGLETVVQCASQNKGISNFLLEFEKFVSKQEVALFSRNEDISRFTIPFGILISQLLLQIILLYYWNFKFQILINELLILYVHKYNLNEFKFHFQPRNKLEKNI